MIETCCNGLFVLRTLTQQLCQDYPLRKELDEHHGYLAFTVLEELLPHIEPPDHEASVICSEILQKNILGNLFSSQSQDSADETSKHPSLSLTSLKVEISLFV